MASELLVGSWRKHLLTYQEFTHSSPVTRRSPRVFQMLSKASAATAAIETGQTVHRSDKTASTSEDMANEAVQQHLPRRDSGCKHIRRHDDAILAEESHEPPVRALSPEGDLGTRHDGCTCSELHRGRPRVQSPGLPNATPGRAA